MKRPIKNFQLEEHNQANDMVQYMLAARNDNTSDEEILEIEEEPLNSVWPVFLCAESDDILVKQRLLKLGKSHYKQPVENPNSLSQKLIPAPVPCQTKHEWKKKAIKAAGSNNKIMQNYFFKIQPAKEAPSNPVIDPNLEFATIEDQPTDESNKEAIQLRLEHILNNYLSAPKAPQSISKTKKAQSQWAELNSALQSATQIYRKRKKKTRTFLYLNL
jgi:hypothetical protein